MAHDPGAVAQLGERSNRTAEVRGSIPLGSTNSQKFLWSRNVLGDVNGNLWTGVL